MDTLCERCRPRGCRKEPPLAAQQQRYTYRLSLSRSLNATPFYRLAGLPRQHRVPQQAHLRERGLLQVRWRGGHTAAAMTRGLSSSDDQGTMPAAAMTNGRAHTGTLADTNTRAMTRRRGHLLESETYIGGKVRGGGLCLAPSCCRAVCHVRASANGFIRKPHPPFTPTRSDPPHPMQVEALESGVFRSDLPLRFKCKPGSYQARARARGGRGWGKRQRGLKPYACSRDAGHVQRAQAIGREQAVCAPSCIRMHPDWWDVAPSTHRPSPPSTC
jgi:hypothetical protein